MKNERVNLTPAKALLLYVLYDLVRNGEYISEFSSEKVSYFLQRFGAKKYFNLDFEPYFYGPYTGKVRFLLNELNGSYIMGYNSMDKNPFEPLTVIADGYESVISYLEINPDQNDIAKKTTSFLRGFYSDFALELLSSVDYIASAKNTLDQDKLLQELSSWND